LQAAEKDLIRHPRQEVRILAHINIVIFISLL